jgi:hypothetical protein
MQVDFDDSFVNNIGKLSATVQDQIGAILRNIENNGSCACGDDSVVCEAEDDICTCQHPTDWGGWKLVCVYLYDTFRINVESVIAVLLYESFNAVQIGTKAA